MQYRACLVSISSLPRAGPRSRPRGRAGLDETPGAIGTQAGARFRRAVAPRAQRTRCGRSGDSYAKKHRDLSPGDWFGRRNTLLDGGRGQLSQLSSPIHQCGNGTLPIPRNSPEPRMRDTPSSTFRMPARIAAQLAAALNRRRSPCRMREIATGATLRSPSVSLGGHQLAQARIVTLATRSAGAMPLTWQFAGDRLANVEAALAHRHGNAPCKHESSGIGFNQYRVDLSVDLLIVPAVRQE